jgi:hypothetical protein
MRIVNRSLREHDALIASVATHTTLEAVVRAALARRVPHAIHRITVQDEFTHDVVVEHAPGTWLVYDTT